MNEVLEYFNLIDACGLGKRMTSLEEMGVQVEDTTWSAVEKTWCEMLGEELEGDVIRLQGIAELEEIWGMKRGEILNAMMRNELNEEENL
jgi:lipoate-protein ligase B